jgi:hypothetical protein
MKADKQGSHSHPVMQCEQNNLSNQFGIELDVQRRSDKTATHDSCVINMYVKDKQTKKRLDTISITSTTNFIDLFASCDTVMSFTTGFNSKRLIVDNNFGYIVVADLNFDQKDDIAIMNDFGSVGGPFYSYFIQGDSKKFSFNRYLTDSVIYFPTTIDRTNHMITVFEHAGVCCTAEEVYQLDRQTEKWKHIKHKLHRQ